MRPFGCPVTVFNTIEHLGKFNGRYDEGFFVGYSLNSKAFRVFNSRTRIVEENLHIRFRENTSNVVASGLDWLFDIDTLKRTMNYEPIVTDPRKESECKDHEKEYNVNNTNNVNAAGTNEDIELLFDPNMPALEDVSIFNFSGNDEDDDAMADMNNLDTTIQVNPIPTIRIHKDHTLD
nr:ribonuclease H-like domain-containing protein [Tanacetum cinerariifolium]